MSLRYDFTTGTVKKDLADLPEKMLDYAFEVLMERARLMKGIWQILIRVDTGSARDSIRLERGGIGLQWRRVRVRGGGYVTNPKTGKLVDYMGYLESKYGAGKAAYRQVRVGIGDMIKARVVENVQS